MSGSEEKFRQHADVRFIDPNHLLELAGGDTAVMRQVLELFVSQVQGWSDILLSAATCREPVRDTCHMIKGSAVSVGASELADMCADIEDALSGTGSVDDLADRLGVLVALLGRVADEADGWVDRLHRESEL